MSIASVKKNGLDLLPRASADGGESPLGGCILAISLATVPRGVAEDVAAPQPNIGIAGGTVEDVNGATVSKAELTLKWPLPCRVQSIVASNTGGFEFRDFTWGVPYQVTATLNGFKEWNVVDDSAHGDTGRMSC